MIGVCFVFVVWLLAGCCRSSSVLDFVDPLIGSGGQGFGAASVPPGAQLPFSSVRLSPDTSHSLVPWTPFDHFGGYHWNDNEIRVFSHLHTQGAGDLDLGILSVLPVNRVPSEASFVQNYGFRSKFSHSREHARPGSYSVFLDSHNVLAELTTGAHFTANHRYSWSGNGGKHVILFPISHAMPQKGCVNSTLNISVSDQMVVGSILHKGSFGGRGNGINPYIVARFNETFFRFGTWNGGKIQPGNSAVFGPEAGGWIEFDVPNVEMVVGVSWLSEEQALANLATAPKTFDAALEMAETSWSNILNQVDVTASENASKEDLTKFYTAMYHANCAPSTLSESGGVYLGFDHQPHILQAPQKAYYSDMSIWDVYRCTFPLMSLLKSQSVMSDIAQSIVLMSQMGGSLPQWPFVDIYTCAMVGQHAQNVLADAFLWGVRGFDTNAAFSVAVKAATTREEHCARRHADEYNQLGFISVETDPRGICLTLAYAHNDFALGQWALLVNSSLAKFFLDRSENYLNVWSREESFFCSRFRNGTFDCPSNKLNVFSDNYVEGDAWHYRFYGTDVFRTFNSSQHFVSELDKFMMDGRIDPLNVLPNPYYWAGNEPDIDAPWQFAVANRSDLTTKHVQWVARHRYTTKPDGIPGNDDYGALSGWLVWAYMGFYPLYSGKTQLSLSAPMFSNIQIKRDDGHVIQIISHGSGETISKVVVDGVAAESTSLMEIGTFTAAKQIEFFLKH